MRCWARSRWAISAPTFPTPIRAGGARTAACCCARCSRKVAGLGWDIGNLDATVIAQAPKLAPHVAAMRANVAADLGCDPSRISIKATTTERLGFAGREEGIAAEAVVLLQRSRSRHAP